jgi:hypothetical protein
MGKHFIEILEETLQRLHDLHDVHDVTSTLSQSKIVLILGLKKIKVAGLESFSGV